jgi:hypothetical protein
LGLAAARVCEVPRQAPAGSLAVFVGRKVEALVDAGPYLVKLFVER